MPYAPTIRRVMGACRRNFVDPIRTGVLIYAPLRIHGRSTLYVGLFLSRVGGASEYPSRREAGSVNAQRLASFGG
jgi:hypothetical protein